MNVAEADPEWAVGFEDEYVAEARGWSARERHNYPVCAMVH